MNDILVSWCIDTPLAPLQIQVSEHGILTSTFVKNSIPNGAYDSALIDAHIHSVQQWVDAYFQKTTLPPLAFNLHNLTTFHQHVLRQLCRIQIGTTVTYSGLAEMCSRPKAARAVGSAMAKNPIGLMIPCHRVVKKNGSLGAYSGWNGAETKKLLLDFESQDSSFDKFMSA